MNIKTKDKTNNKNPYRTVLRRLLAIT